MLSILVATLFFLLLLAALYAAQRTAAQRSRMRRETREAENVLHAVFDALKEDVVEQFSSLRKLRGRKREEEQERIAQDVEKNMRVAEHFAQKEIEDIEKELE